MLTYLTFLLYILSLNCSASHVSPNDVTTFNSALIRKPRVSGSSGRLSLINYRFNRRPRKKNLDTRELKMVLGSAYNPKFMSIEEPPELASPDEGAIYVVQKDSWRYGDLVKELQISNLTLELQQLAGDNFAFREEYVTIMEKWLLQKASCPVKYAWEDVGALFWPRYIRRGECSTGSGSCSWPSGMHCVPSGTTNINILRWQCRTPKNKGRKKAHRSSVDKDLKVEEKPLNLKCNWVRVPYPITNECICTC